MYPFSIFIVSLPHLSPPSANLRDLASLAPPEQVDSNEALRAIIQAIIGKWFNKKRHPNNSEQRIATKAFEDNQAEP